MEHNEIPSYIFPYSLETEVKRKEIIENLQKGLLLEKSNVFVPWGMRFAKLVDILPEQMASTIAIPKSLSIKESIIGGLSCSIHINSNQSTGDAISQVVLGTPGQEGFVRFIDEIKAVLGEPTSGSLLKTKDFAFTYNEFDYLGKVTWNLSKVKLEFSGWEQFGVRYQGRIEYQ